jgi:hypothetical protein
MDYSLTFARHFARLVWLLSYEPTNTDEQKAALRALLMLAREGFVTLGTRADQLTANGTALPLALSGVPDVVNRMAALGVQTIDVDRNATAADLLRLARQFIATTPDLAHAAGATARFGGVVPAATTADAAPEPPGARRLDLDFGEVLDDPLAAALERGTPHRAMPAVPAFPAAKRAVGGMFDQFAAARSSAATHDDVLGRLDAETSPVSLIELLDELAVRAEEAMRDDPPVRAIEIFRRIVQRERDAHDLDVKRAFVHTVKRLAKPALLRAVAADLARSAEDRERTLAVLARIGEDGADALIEQLATEEGRAARRIFFDALLQLQAGIPTLVHMLGDARWYVARNAAALLGEMEAREAEQPLVGLLHHDDERVRHAATVALMRLGTARSLPTILDALNDSAPHIRMQAAAALETRREEAGSATAALLRALDGERDEEVAATFLVALGRLATGDAVARLIATAEPDRGLFRRKPGALRVAAVQGLGEARSPEALEALEALRSDKDEDVRATAVYALGGRAR